MAPNEKPSILFDELKNHYKHQQVRSIVAEYDLSPNDVFPAGRAARVATAPTAKVAPKYRDPRHGPNLDRSW